MFIITWNKQTENILLQVLFFFGCFILNLKKGIRLNMFMVFFCFLLFFFFFFFGGGGGLLFFFLFWFVFFFCFLFFFCFFFFGGGGCYCCCFSFCFCWVFFLKRMALCKFCTLSSSNGKKRKYHSRRIYSFIYLQLIKTINAYVNKNMFKNTMTASSSTYY